ncbi:hypothetical protein EG327_008146 [Venturia inaequalis]|uniref:Major facilitator superfamily (MFS) profile domain-containing protein n=1 Tax=Venturia inaequalis TaxID=5025 RepID=A0A8H3UVF6_VENIN|nr:hypothetical protein EG327_008146 [Venturia inaequalis]
MACTTSSDDASSIFGLDQDKPEIHISKQEQKSQSHKELDHPQHEIIASIDTKRDVEEPPVEKVSSQMLRDPNLVTWDSDNDPANPHNWSLKRKWAVVFVVSAFTFISPVSSSMIAPALGNMKIDLGIRDDFEAAMTLSIFVLAFALGPLLFGPLSELYGRVRVLQCSNLIFLIFNIVCGFARTGPQMLAFRYFAGFGGSALLALGGGILADTFDADHRGQAIGIYSVCPLLGPAVGPVAGGFITENTTWRWVFWSTTIFCALVQITGLLFLQETYAPILLKRKAAKLRKESGNPALYTEFDDPDRKLTTDLRTAFERPFRLLFTQPIVQVISVYMAYNYGLLYLMLTSFPTLWTKRYGESLGIGSLHYIGLGIGLFLGSQITAPLSDRIYKKLKHRNGGIGKPEFRVPLMFVGAAITPMALFWYGWSAQARTHWIVPTIGAGVFAAGTIINYGCMQAYIVDSYTRYAASGLAATAVLRSLSGFSFPLFANTLFAKLGYGWGNSLLGFVAIAFGIPAPLIFWRFGERLRARSEYAAG